MLIKNGHILRSEASQPLGGKTTQELRCGKNARGLQRNHGHFRGEARGEIQDSRERRVK